MGGKPSKGTKKDRRLSANQPKPRRRRRGIFGKRQTR